MMMMMMMMMMMSNALCGCAAAAPQQWANRQSLVVVLTPLPPAPLPSQPLLLPPLLHCPALRLRRCCALIALGVAGSVATGWAVPRGLRLPVCVTF